MLQEGPKSVVSVSYLEWEKVDKQNTNNNTGDKRKITNRVPKVVAAGKLADLTEKDFDLASQEASE